MQRWAIRPFTNQPLAKNTTDMSLALDAMALVCITPRPTQFVIGSGDLDFVPLAVRLRELGIKVVCVSERRKMAQEAVCAYDEVIYVGDDQAALAAVSLTVKAVIDKPDIVLPKVVTGVALKKALSTTPKVKMAAAKPIAAKKAPAKKVAAQPKGLTDVTVTLDKILAAVPDLLAGKPLALAKVVKILHDRKLLAKNASSTKLFKSFADNFALTPTGKPNQIHFIVPD